MAIQSFIFGPGQKFKTQEELERARELVKQMYGGNGAPKNLGEGLSALGDGIAMNVMNRRLSRGQSEFDTNRADADSSFISGMPDLTGAAFPSSVAAGGSSTAPAATGVASGGQVAPEIRDGIIQTASSLGIDPVDLGTAISYETAGTFDPTKAGPRTKWGQHKGLIQFGEPQAQQYGVDWKNPVGSQLGENGAVAKYLRDRGVKPGMGMLDIYSTINAGAPGLYNRSDAKAGGAPGTVADKVRDQMAGHRAKAIALLGIEAPKPVQVASLDPSVGMEQAIQQPQQPTREQVVQQQQQLAARNGFVDGQPVEQPQQPMGLAAAQPNNYPEAGKIAPVDWAAQPRFSVAAGLGFEGGPQPQGEQTESLSPQQPISPQQPPLAQNSGISARGLAAHDQMMGGIFAPQDQSSVQVADASGSMPAGRAPQGAGTQGEIRRGTDGKSYQYAQTTGMAGANGEQGWIPVQSGAGGGYFPPAPSRDRAPIQQAQQQQPQSAQAQMQYLARAISNPFLSPEMKRLAATQYQQLVERQQQASDPATQLDMQYKQAQIDALKAKPQARFQPLITPEQRAAYGIPSDDKRPYQIGPDGKLDAIGSGQNISIQTASEVDTRRRIAEENGLKQGDPAYQSYILTGKMPREDASPLTATDKKAILEADEMVLSNQNAIDQLSSTIAGDPGKTLNDRAGYGATAGWQSWAARNDPTGLFSDDKGEATTEFNNIVLGQALSSLKATFGAAPTEGERAILIDLQASVDKTPAERKKIIDRGIALANKRLEFNRQRADELRGQTFYKPGGGGTGGSKPAAPSADGWQDLGGGVRLRVK